MAARAKFASTRTSSKKSERSTRRKKPRARDDFSSVPQPEDDAPFRRLRLVITLDSSETDDNMGDVITRVFTAIGKRPDDDEPRGVH